MTWFSSLRRDALGLLCLLAAAVGPATPAHAVSPVKFDNAVIMCDPSLALSPVTVDGTASHLGKLEGDGEVFFLPGEEPGSLVGVGPVVPVAANGDRLAGTITIDLSPPVGGEVDALIHISWRDSVEFDDGSTGSSTGRFAKRRPPGVAFQGIGTHEWISFPLCIVRTR